MKVTFRKTAPAVTDFKATSVLENAVKLDQTRNLVSFYLDTAKVDMSLAGTWHVEVSDPELSEGAALTFDMIIVAGCQKHGPNKVTFPPVTRPLDHSSTVTLQNPSWRPILPLFS